MANPGRNREQWLRAAIRAMEPWIRAAAKETGVKAEFPDSILVGVGFTPTRKRGVEAIGSCFASESHKDKKTQTIFVCPTLDDPVRVLDVVLHEMVHASLPFEVGHKRPFKQMVEALGLAGKATATYAEVGSQLHSKLAELAAKLGPYPHVAISGKEVEEKRKKGQSKWVRLRSTTIEKYTCVVSAKMLDEHGRPLDPLGEEMVPVDEESDDDGED